MNSKSIGRTCSRREAAPCESRGAHAANSAHRSAHMRTDVLASCGCVRYAGQDAAHGASGRAWAKWLVEAAARAAGDSRAAVSPRRRHALRSRAGGPTANECAAARCLLPQPPPRHGRRTDARWSSCARGHGYARDEACPWLRVAHPLSCVVARAHVRAERARGAENPVPRSARGRVPRCAPRPRRTALVAAIVSVVHACSVRLGPHVEQHRPVKLSLCPRL